MLELNMQRRGLTAKVERLERLGLALRDLAPLAKRCEEILAEELYNSLANQEDAATGARVDDLKPSTLKRRRGSGPPRIPRHRSSRMANPDIKITGDGATTWEIRASWPDFPQIRFHVKGTRYMVARNPIGVPPRARVRIAEAVREAIERALAAGRGD